VKGEDKDGQLVGHIVGREVKGGLAYKILISK